jgi:hypothetical protein
MITTTMLFRRVVCWTIPCALSLALVVISAPRASASFMAPGASLPASGEPDPTGPPLFVASTGPVAFASGDYSGTLNSTVFTNDASSPFGLGSLTFTYLLTNDAVSSGEIDRLTVNDFAGFLVDSSYQTPAAGVTPTQMSRSGVTDAGNVVGFTFLGAPFGFGVLTPGSSSALLVVQTDATTFAPSVASVIDGHVTSVDSLAPGGPGAGVPEPCSVVLAGIGLVAVSIIRLRSRSRRC